MELTKTVRGKEKLCADGYGYIVDKKVNARYYWKCERYKECGGRMVTLYDGERGEHTEKGRKEHNHLPDSTRAEVLRAKGTIKSRAVASAAPPVQIIQVTVFILYSVKCN